MKKIIFIGLLFFSILHVKAQEGNNLTPEDFCNATGAYLNELVKNNFNGFLSTKIDSFEMGGEYNYTYASINPFPAALETVIQDPFMKSDYYRYARITLIEMPSVNGAIDDNLYNLYQNLIFVLKDCLTPNGFVFHRHDMDDLKIYKCRTTLTLPSKQENTGFFANLQKSNDLMVDMYIDQLDSETSKPATHKLIMMIKVG